MFIIIHETSVECVLAKMSQNLNDMNNKESIRFTNSSSLELLSAGADLGFSRGGGGGGGGGGGEFLKIFESFVNLFLGRPI